ncbi:MAG: Gfo/Idh/MocA family oxidoreductase [Planctomycetaceae bacterium]|nr:Gfo/Idh/MocA family oxidoreductase [Planctomycetaceae bacterium]
MPFRRRQFIKGVTAAGLGLAAPLFVPARVFGANERIRTGHIGVGGQGRSNLKALLSHAVAVCDVDTRHSDQAAKMIHEAGGACEVYGDYRKLLERSDIDAVVISTPDHWHALQTIQACEAGKDVYVEKPLSLTIAEGRRMVQAARQHHRIVQTGSQQRSSDNFRRACELVRSGVLGAIQEIHVGIAAANHPFRERGPVPDSRPPEHLDYPLWLGPAPWVEYNQLRVHYNFRFFWDYSGGQMTNWGAHHIDIAHWGMGWDHSGPARVSGSAEFHPQAWHEVSESCRITYEYPTGTKMIVGQQQPDISMGTKFIGTQGWIFVDRGKLQSSDPELLKKSPDETKSSLIRSGNHHQNFLQCIKSRELPICDVEIGHRTATACHLGNIAIRTGQVIDWDHETEQFQDATLASWMDRNDREF